MITGTHCELWEINTVTGSRMLCEVYVLYDLLPAELFYRLTINVSGLHIRDRPCGWQWQQPNDEQIVEQYLRTVQRSGEEIFIEVCLPEPDLPGYPHTDYHPIDFPAIL